MSKKLEIVTLTIFQICMYHNTLCDRRPLRRYSTWCATFCLLSSVGSSIKCPDRDSLLCSCYTNVKLDAFAWTAVRTFSIVSYRPLRSMSCLMFE
jgi:hypothetical protein